MPSSRNTKESGIQVQYGRAARRRSGNTVVGGAGIAGSEACLGVASRCSHSEGGLSIRGLPLNGLRGGGSSPVRSRRRKGKMRDVSCWKPSPSRKKKPAWLAFVAKG